MKEVLQVYELLDKPEASGKEAADLLRNSGADEVTVTRIRGKRGSTEGIKITITGEEGKANGGDVPTLGIIGRLGGLGARPGITGFVSDGDGALTALSAALKLADMKKNGDILPGDIIITTHICPDAPTRSHKPVPFMDSPIDMKAMNEHEVVPEMDAIISIDTTKGNKVINHKGFCISPTIKAGYILKVSESLISVMETVTGKPAVIIPVSQQDITPYANGLYHINSIFQPAVATNAPLVGLAITTETPVAGCATGASHPVDIEQACRFVVETAKLFGSGECPFYDRQEFSKLVDIYGKMNKFQTLGMIEGN